MSDIRCSAKPISVNAFRSFLWLMVSKAFSKSIKHMCSGCLRALARSVISLRLHRWLCVPLWGRNPACVSSISDSAFALILSRITFSSTLLACDTNDIRLTLSNRCNSVAWRTHVIEEQFRTLLLVGITTRLEVDSTIVGTYCRVTLLEQWYEDWLGPVFRPPAGAAYYFDQSVHCPGNCVTSKFEHFGWDTIVSYCLSCVYRFERLLHLL